MDRSLLKSVLLFVSLIELNGMIHADNVRCLKEDLASIHGLMPGMKASVGLPLNYLSVDAISGEDDGGYYTGQKYKYDKFEIITVRGYIDSIRITSPLISWAGTITIGMDRDKIDNSLEYARIYMDDTSSQYLVCSKAGDVYAILGFSANNLKSIEILIDRP